MNANVETPPVPAGTGSKDLVLIQTSLTDIDKVGAGLAKLRELYAGVIYDVRTAEGMEAARKARQAVRAPRFEVERIRKAGKAPILDLGRKLDLEAARITGEIEQIERPIDKQIKAEEERIEQEKAAKAAAELARVNGIRKKIQAIVGLPMDTYGDTSQQVQARIQKLIALDINEPEFGEFTREAGEVRAAVLDQLKLIQLNKANAEKEAIRAAEEREELRRQREKQEAEAARLRAVAEEQERTRQAQLASQQAELDRRQAEIEEREREQQEQLERDEAQRAALAAMAPAAAIVERDPAIAAEQTWPENVATAGPGVAPMPLDIIECLVETFGEDQQTVLDWLRAVDWKAVEL